MAGYLSPELELPWSSSAEEDQLFKRILKALLVILLVFGLVIPFVPLPERDREEEATLPPQLARLILEREQAPPPPPPPPPEPEPVREALPPETVPETPRPEPSVQAQPVPQPDPATVARARERAAASGLLTMRDELADMRAAFQPSAVETQTVTRGEAQAAQTDRSRLTSQVTTTSGGVSDAELSRDTGGAALSGRETTQVESQLATAAAEGPATAASGSGGEQASRTSEDVRRVIDQHMGGIFAIYNRALRQNPALQGKVVVRLVIEPAGNISDATIVSSELDDTELEGRLLARILMISFPAANVARTTVNYTFDFLPQ